MGVVMAGEGERGRMGGMTDVVDEWLPGDPLYPEQGPQIRMHCGPCLAAWTADTDRCPECGELSTEALRAAIERVRARHADAPPHPHVSHPQCEQCQRPAPCHEIAALDGVVAAPF